MDADGNSLTGAALVPSGLNGALAARRRATIDAHTHVSPAMAPALAQIMDANGISHVVNLGMLELLGIPFQEGMRTYRDVLGDRMVYFSTPDWRDTAPGFGERMACDLERKVDAGARGLKIFKELGLRHRDAAGWLIPVDDPRLDTLWAKAGELGIPVLIHTADPLAFFGPLEPTNERWEELERHPDWHFGRPEFPSHDDLLEQRNRVLARHPGTVFIGAHLGEYPENLAYVSACLDRHPNFFVDTSARIGEIGRHPAAEVRAFFARHQDCVLLGSDLVLGWGHVDARPVDLAAVQRFYEAHWRFFETSERGIEHPGYPIQGRWAVDAVGLPEEVLDKLYVRNARRLIAGLW